MTINESRNEDTYASAGIIFVLMKVKERGKGERELFIECWLKEEDIGKYTLW